jgi:GxxExxY protein
LNHEDAKTQRKPGKDIEDIARQIVHAAFTVHSALGPGLLESAYQACLAYELASAGVHVVSEINLPVIYREIKIDAGYRIDMLIENMIIIENKAVEKLLPVHQAQLLTYMKLTEIRLGFLLNWNVPVIKEGIRRMALNL